MRSAAEILRWRARFQPESTAICHKDRRLTYHELDQCSSRVANALIRMGVTKDERVAVLDKSHDRLVETIFGIGKAGAVFTPINWRLTGPEIQKVLADAQARFIFLGEEFADAFSDAHVNLPNLRTVIGYDRPRADWLPYEHFIGDASNTDPALDSDGDSTCWQMYTSGTTGLPRGVEITHANLYSMCTSGLVDMGGPGQPVALNCMPLFHIGGSGFLLHAIYAGARIILTREANSAELLNLIEQERVTHALFVPAMLNFMLQQPGIDERDFSRLRMIVYGASPIAEDLLKRSIEVFGCEFVQAYGLTETTGSVTMLKPDDHKPGFARLRSCGLPILGHEVRIVDSNGRTCRPFEVGEIVVRGSNVMKGYWNQPDATAAVLQNGWLKTGDAGYCDEGGYLFIHDRIKDMIVSGGENVYPAEVESVLYSHPGVADAAVIGVPDERWGEAVKAVIVRAKDSRVTEADLLAHCRSQLAGYKQPRSVDFVEELPRTPSGKILKRALREKYWRGRERRLV